LTKQRPADSGRWRRGWRRIVQQVDAETSLQTRKKSADHEKSLRTMSLQTIRV
jgi:hypothetical protein